MANPFLVLGGIAISVATAAFGILQVPGWVASAQDAAAINDVALVAQAQAVRLAETGRFSGTVAALSNSSVKFTESAGVHVRTATDPTGKHHLTVARSQSGAFFARSSSSAEIGRGTNAETAAISAGVTITGPAGARVTSDGVPVPTGFHSGQVVTTNLITNPSFEGPELPVNRRVTAAFDTGWAADGSRSLAVTRDNDASRDAYVDISNLIAGGITSLKPNTRYTVMATYRLNTPLQGIPEGASGTSMHQRLGFFVHLNDQLLVMATGVNNAGQRTVRSTFTAPEAFNGINTMRLYAGDIAGSPHNVSWDAVGVFEGDVAVDDWFTGDTPSRGDLQYEWAGEPHNSASIAYR